MFGEAIRSLRLEHGLTQERLSDGICSASSLSKIENGSQVPSRQTFRLLMERLGEPGYTYAHFQTETEYLFYLALSEFMENVERGITEELDETLLRMQKSMKKDDAVMRQAYEMARTLWYHLCGIDGSGYAQRCMSVFFIRREGSRLPDDLPRMALDEIEMWVVNNIAAGMLWQDRKAQALTMFFHLYQRARRMPAAILGIGKMRGILCNNLALCLLGMGRYPEAERYCDIGLSGARYEGGVFLEMRLLSLKAEIAKAGGRLRLYREQEHLLRAIESMFPHFLRSDVPVEGYRPERTILIL